MLSFLAAVENLLLLFPFAFFFLLAYTPNSFLFFFHSINVYLTVVLLIILFFRFRQTFQSFNGVLYEQFLLLSLIFINRLHVAILPILLQFTSFLIENMVYLIFVRTPCNNTKC